MEATPNVSLPALAGRSSKIGLALAGGAPQGAVYEIGALRALDEALGGASLTDLTMYVGVSSGALLSACLANGITPAQLCRTLAGAEPGEPPFHADTFLTPCYRELARGGRDLPGLLGGALWDYVTHPGEATILESLTRLVRALPAGLFDNEPVRRYLEQVFTRQGRTDDFRQLKKPLTVVAAELDSGVAVRFGEPGLDHVPISLAVQASAALPGLYPPVEIEGRHYVDGILLKTLHASVALEKGADLVICINPIVPVDTRGAVEAGVLTRDKLVDYGLPVLLSQALRTLIHSRMGVGMAAYDTRFPDADVILLEPEHDDYKMFFTNIFSFSERIQVCSHAYQSTRRNLLARYDKLAPIFARHGLTLRRDVLESPRNLWTGVGAPGARLGTQATESGRVVVRRLSHALDRLDRLVDRRLA
ncbi:MAG TPA: patatin-like phospholipase family protein [Thermoanaerobaculia bacterium]|nr:patatin-like phospholipase family protein [Thermoanaerobaculia bacterium]